MKTFHENSLGRKPHREGEGGKSNGAAKVGVANFTGAKFKLLLAGPLFTAHNFGSHGLNQLLSWEVLQNLFSKAVTL